MSFHGITPVPSSFPAIRQIDASSVPNHNIPNVLIFGETGIGKSALINMLADKEVALSSSEASGCTFESTPYQIVIDDKEYRIWDTAGLNEAEGGNVDPTIAITQLAKLTDELHNSLNLLVYCIRGTRFRPVIKHNFELFHTVITGGKVPIVLVVTGLEQEDDMEDWWGQNEAELHREGVFATGHACVTTTLGKKMDGAWIYQSEYDLSRGLVKMLVKEHCLEQAYVLQRAPDFQGFVRERYHSGNEEVSGRMISHSGSSSRLDNVVDFLAQAFTFLLELATRNSDTRAVSGRRRQSYHRDERQDYAQNLNSHASTSGTRKSSFWPSSR